MSEKKTYLRAYAPSEDSYQPALFEQSDHNLHWAHFGQPRMQRLFMQTTKTDGTVMMCRVRVI